MGGMEQLGSSFSLVFFALHEEEFQFKCGFDGLLSMQGRLKADVSAGLSFQFFMVALAKGLTHRIVIPASMGSNPICHPTKLCLVYEEVLPCMGNSTI